MDIKKIKKKLPNGSFSEIAKIAGVKYSAVQTFFNGKKTRQDIKVIEATTEYLTEYNAKRKEAEQRLQDALNS